MADDTGEKEGGPSHRQEVAASDTEDVGGVNEGALLRKVLLFHHCVTITILITVTAGHQASSCRWNPVSALVPRSEQRYNIPRGSNIVRG